jgi:hypothetical protein
MTESNQTPQEQSPEVFEYQQETPNEIMDTVRDTEQSITASADEVNAARERAAFETYVQEGGKTIPENFADAGSWFDSLKEAQKNYTQGQQEIAELKKQYSDTGPINPNATEPEKPVEAVSEPLAEGELRIPPKTEEPVEELSEASENILGVDQSNWDNWSYEVAATGTLSEETRQDITNRTGLNGPMIDDFLTGQKAKMRESYAQAGSVVGGMERLQSMLQWASENLSEDVQYSINAGMATPNMRDITLRGLASKYDADAQSKPINNEPEATQNRVNQTATKQTYTTYTTRREFLQDRNNPRFKVEPKFREAVEQRMMRTNWNTLPE